ncbi:hypothetical protein IMZ38_04045 [Thermosphaera chiliense]|uniref:Uncharacterized protein n=1 Tax=Thermosphaera chiliense TaxID=3402707 RepID=A0A7M1US35_9CREN|nr:hypothetical protein [Thermosphaera aggregans]QOR93832.1 hypothetical protein IMZ38_04045 [Thermosphaera aggregans]
MGEQDKKNIEEKLIPGVILDEDAEEIYYELTGSKCSKCPLRGMCG